MENVQEASRAYEKIAGFIEGSNPEPMNTKEKSSMAKFLENPENSQFLSGGNASTSQSTTTTPTASTKTEKPINESSLRRQLEDLGRAQLENMIIEMYKNDKKYKQLLKIING
jgi:hypothetical protein